MNFVLIIPLPFKNVLLYMKSSPNNMYLVLHVFRVYKNGIELCVIVLMTFFYFNILFSKCVFVDILNYSSFILTAVNYSIVPPFYFPFKSILLLMGI